MVREGLAPREDMSPFDSTRPPFPSEMHEIYLDILNYGVDRRWEYSVECKHVLHGLQLKAVQHPHSTIHYSNVRALLCELRKSEFDQIASNIECSTPALQESFANNPKFYK